MTAAAQPAEMEDEVTTPTPLAGEGETSARSHFRVGQLMYGEGRFDEAAAEFDRAYELSGRPQLLYNAYLAHRDAGHVAEAVDRLRQYLAQSPDAGDRAVLEQRLAAMEETLAEQRRIANMSAEERAALEAENARAAQEAEAQRRAADRLRNQRERDAQRSNPTPLIILGAGAGVLVGGVIMGVVAKTTSLADLEDNCPGNVCVSGFPLDSTRDQARRRTIATDVLLGVGGATAVTGLVLYLVQRRRYADEDEDDSTARRTEVMGGCGPAGCNMNVQVTF
ncbi:MAG: tetratricopeptide repeat protein [Myxococcales bacterium]|nr:tetratricopeptide repeat protein [Myxococcales bacterium]